MTPTYRSSRQNNWEYPRQRRWNDWGHGPIMPMKCPKGETPMWIGVPAIVIAIGVICTMAVMYG